MLELEMKDGTYVFDNGRVTVKSNQRIRGFEKVKTCPIGVPEPVRKTAMSCCYDMFMPKGITIQPHSFSEPIEMGYKAYMQPNECLEIVVRSSIGLKKHLIMPNAPAQIDADYYNSEDNEGNIIITLYNLDDKPVTLEKCERVVQAKFVQYFVADNDKATGKRTGGVGSTGRK